MSAVIPKSLGPVWPTPYRVLGVAGFLLLWPLPVGVHAQGVAIPRAELVLWFRHQEKRVHSMVCEYERVTQPTDPDGEATIRRALAASKDPNEWRSYVRSKESAAAHSAVAKWYRKGEKDLLETFPIDADPSKVRPVVRAYDGQVRRVIRPASANSPTTAMIDTKDSARWLLTPRDDPISWTYRYCEIPYSDLIEKAPKCEARRIRRNNEDATEIAFSCPATTPLSQDSLVLIFDSQRRLVERRIYTTLGPKAPTFLYQRHLLCDYRVHGDSSGEAIWFPWQADYESYIHARLLDGKPVVALKQQFRVRNIAFNVELSDAIFEPMIPNGAAVYDGITGLGWLAPGVRPPVLFPREGRPLWPRVLGVFVATLVVAGSAVWVSKKQGLWSRNKTRQCDVPRRGFTLVEVLVVIAIIGVLIALVLPAVQRVRDASYRAQCANNLRQIGLALHQYHDSGKALPTGCSYQNGADPYPFMSWNTRVLPFLEQHSLWTTTVQAFVKDPRFLNNPPHVGLATLMGVYSCPADGRTLSVGSVNSRAVAFTSYLGVEGTDQFQKDGVLFLDSSVRFSEITDGMSSTLLVGERPPSADGVLGWWYAGEGQGKDGSGDMVLGARERNVFSPWGRGCPAGPYGFGPGRANNQCDAFHFWSLHLGAGAHFLFADGSVRFLGYSGTSTMPALATRSGGELVTITD